MQKYYEKYIKQHEQIWVLFVFILGWGALFVQHINVGMFFDDYGNASLSYSYEVSGIIGTNFGIRAILEWAYHIYMGWGGRLLYACLFLIPMLKHGIEVFMVMQSFIIILILYAIYKMACKVMDCRTSFPASVFTCVLYCLIDITFHNNGTYWASASVLYIWPLLPMFLAVMYYNYVSECIKNNKKYSKARFYIVESILILFTTLSQEQWGGAFIVFIVFYILFHHFRDERKYVKVDVYVGLYSLGTYLLMLMSPGNMARMTGDQEAFSKLSLVEKIQTNLPILLDVFVSKDFFYITLLLMIANIFIAGLLLYSKKKNIWYRVLIALTILCFAGYVTIYKFNVIGTIAEIFSMSFLIITAATAITYFVKIGKLEYFAFLMAAVASVFCLVISPYVVYRSYLGYIFIAFTYIVIAFVTVINNNVKIVKYISSVLIVVFMFCGLSNYTTILKGYYENNYITQYNVRQLENWNGNSYIVLYSYPQKYSMYRNLSMSDETDYSPVIERWVRRYYGISDTVYFIWKDMGENLENTIFLENGKGIYGTETKENESWNWAEKESELKIYNFYQGTYDGILKLKVETPQANEGQIIIEINDNEYAFNITSSETDIEIPVELSKGLTNVHIKADVNKVDSGEDSRKLYMKIIGENLLVSE